MFSIIFFCVLFVAFYLIYYFIFDDKLKKEKYTKISELTFIVSKFKLDKKKMDYRKCLNGIAIINGFIIAFTITIIDIIPISIMYKLGIAFVMLMGLIFSLYMIYGKYLQKKWGKK